MGDFNSHHILWFSKRNDSNGKFLAEYINNNNWSVHNNSSPTYTPVHRIESHSIIDLILSNSSGADSIRNFVVDEDEDLGSDHSPVYFEISGVFRITNNVTVSSSFNTISWSKYNTLLINLETKLKVRTIETEKDIDNNLTELESAINSALIGSTRIKTVSNKELLILPEHIIKLIKSTCEVKFFKDSRSAIQSRS